MKTHKIGVMGGDGTGPEVTVEAVKVMEAAAAKFGFKVEQTEYDFGGERYMKTGEILPDGASAGCYRPPGCQTRHPRKRTAAADAV
jgi:3-isopropylmalate dehydrogenase